MTVLGSQAREPQPEELNLHAARYPSSGMAVGAKTWKVQGPCLSNQETQLLLLASTDWRPDITETGVDSGLSAGV